jgi:hypothetical protein
MFQPGRFTLGDRVLRDPLVSMQGGLQYLSGVCGEEKYLRPPPRIKHRFFGCMHGGTTFIDLSDVYKMPLSKLG